MSETTVRNTTIKFGVREYRDWVKLIRKIINMVEVFPADFFDSNIPTYHTNDVLCSLVQGRFYCVNRYQSQSLVNLFGQNQLDKLLKASANLAEIRITPNCADFENIREIVVYNSLMNNEHWITIEFYS